MKTLQTLLALALAAVVGLTTARAQSTNEFPVVPANNYLLSPNDIILVKVFLEPDLDSQHRVSRDGSINFPLVGRVNVAGQTVETAAVVIREKLMDGYIRNPQVRVNILQYAERRVTVLGQVQKPGTYVLPNEETTDLLQAVAMAGGFTRMADTRKVIVRRTIDGRESVLSVDAKSLSRDNSALPFEVQPDDKITVGERLF